MTADEWKAAWPKHCTACGGWGGSTYWDNHGIPGAGEACCDPCEAIDDPTICHRCGEHGLDEDAEGPCTACGWNYDDGEPEVQEAEDGTYATREDVWG